ncbi:MoaD/ThiS family protein [Sediminibacterium soli]|uniref:MoaD/ThiS family protein n=1 Tax=Sediminibacterium soli TaxID=2698829 RepID=UPI00137A4FCC|nr:MoaD/ThiS family protein [Sediminibacterium soli]NCI47691.1 MoaD/ThiS family protein [Sediminibacterium soli]
MNRIAIQLFGQLCDIAQSDRILLPAVDDTEQLINALFAEYPGLRSATFLLAVDKKIVRGKQSIQPDAEIALLPPFSGG